MNNTITEMKTTLEGMNSRITEAIWRVLSQLVCGGVGGGEQTEVNDPHPFSDYSF